MRVLVCGGAGYIGSNMTAMLVKEGHEPIVYDNLSKGHKCAIGDTPLVRGDLSNYELILKSLKDYRIEAVMHFAAFIEVGESVQTPLRYYRNNVANTLTVLEAMENAGVDRFVFSSTAAVYGMPDVSRISENTPKMPINPYGDSKWDIERMCQFQSKTGRLRYAALRYFNACGAGNDGKLGEDHTPETHLIPLIIQAAMGTRNDVKIFGTDYPTPDGTCIRDYIHIEDLCSAHLLALKALDRNRELVYNLGNGTGYSVRQVINTIKKISGKDFKIIEDQRRPGDPPILTADSTKAMKELGWVSRFAQLETIVQTAWNWHNEYPNGYKD